MPLRDHPLWPSAATECELSLTTVWVGIPAGAYEKVTSDLALGRRFCRFPPLLRLSLNMPGKVTIIEIPSYMPSKSSE